MSWLSESLTFKGRAGRGAYWATNVVVNVFSLGLALALRSLSGYIEGQQMTFSLVSLAVTLLLMWPGLAVLVRRGHDRGRPAVWSICLFILVTGAFFFVRAAGREGSLPGGAIGYGVAVVGVMLLLYQVIDYAFWPGQPLANRYGPPHGGGVTRPPLVL